MAAADPSAIRRPDGIDEIHIDPRHRLGRHSSILSLGVLGTVLAIGLSGRVGVSSQTHRVDAPAARLEMKFPKVLRSGSFVETRIEVQARTDIAELVLAFEPSIWREVTTVSIRPSPADESHSDGLLRFGFDRLAAGQRFELQIQQQVNPSRFGSSQGRFVLFDGERPLLEVPLAYQVLP